MTRKKLTIREEVLEVLRFAPYCHGATAQQMWHYMNVHEPGVGFTYKRDRVKLASLSGQLNRMVKDGTLDVLLDFGIRGGNGYIVARPKLKPEPKPELKADPYNHSSHYDYYDPYCPACGGNAYGQVINPDWRPR